MILRKNLLTTIVAVLFLFSTTKTDCMETVTQNINDYIPGSSYITLALGSLLALSVFVNVVKVIREANLINTYEDQLTEETQYNTLYRTAINNWNNKNPNNKITLKN